MDNDIHTRLRIKMKKIVLFYVMVLCIFLFFQDKVSGRTEVDSQEDYKVTITNLRLWQTEWKTYTDAKKDDVMIELFQLIEDRYIVEKALQFQGDITR